MQYISTRNKNAKVSPAEAIVRGISPDGGLYVPESIPTLDGAEFEKLRGMDYASRSAYIIGKYLDGFTSEELLEATKSAYSRFDGDAAPLVKVDDNIYMLELWHGPTLAFKDIALTLLPHLLRLSKRKTGDNSETKILVATSGDTGKAALEGFRDTEGASITVFYPSDGVSSMQKLQMMTQEGSNVSVYGIKGNFDDCQTAVKSVFADKEIRERLAQNNVRFSSANSINWGRLLPQIVYYVSAYVDLLEEGQINMGDKINFCVPTGNFGDILAGWYACKMGVPVNKLICASNRNNVLTDFFNKGKYVAKRKFYKTMSPSMDILVSSNLERLIFEYSGRNDELTKERMTSLFSDAGAYEITKEELSSIGELFWADWSSEDDTIETIESFFHDFNYPLDPHSSVAAAVYASYRNKTEDTATPVVIISTANPYKFPQDVLFALTGDDVRDPFRATKRLLAETAMEVPESIQVLKTKPKLHERVIPVGEIKSLF